MVYLTPLILMHLFFLWAKLRDDLSVIDIFWSLGFWSMSLTAFVLHGAPHRFQVVYFIMISLWALRLAGYLGWRLLSHGKEDQRYTNMRKSWGDKVWLTGYFRVYWLQFSLMCLISTPLYFYLTSTLQDSYSVNHVAGTILFLYGFVFQVWGDFGLASFKSNPENKGKIYTQGAWKYSQHPNYFGEAAMWIGFFVFAFNLIPIWTIIGPITIIFFLLKVSGIPLLKMGDKYARDPRYGDYKEKTSLFIPWFPEE